MNVVQLVENGSRFNCLIELSSKDDYGDDYLFSAYGSEVILIYGHAGTLIPGDKAKNKISTIAFPMRINEYDLLL